MGLYRVLVYESRLPINHSSRQLSGPDYVLLARRVYQDRPVPATSRTRSSTCMAIRKSMMVAASPRCSILDATHSTVENVVVDIVIETGRSGSLICVIHLLCSNSRFPTSSYYLLGKLNSVSISNSRLPRQYSLQSTEYCIHWSAHEARKLRGSYTK